MVCLPVPGFASLTGCPSGRGLARGPAPSSVARARTPAGRSAAGCAVRTTRSSLCSSSRVRRSLSSCACLPRLRFACRSLLLQHVAQDPVRETDLDVRDRALLLVGWQGALRRSEIVELDWVDVRGVSGGCLLMQRGTKSGGDAPDHPIIRSLDPRACPVRALEAWRRRAERLGGGRAGAGVYVVGREGRQAVAFAVGVSVGRDHPAEARGGGGNPGGGVGSAPHGAPSSSGRSRPSLSAPRRGVPWRPLGRFRSLAAPPQPRPRSRRRSSITFAVFALIAA